MADVRDDADDQLVDACIGLEALLGQEGAELSYSVAVRVAALLSSKKDKPLDAGVVFDLARKVYNRRSELVHGSVSGKHESFTLHIRPSARHRRHLKPVAFAERWRRAFAAV
jgi:hypothetical protein